MGAATSWLSGGIGQALAGPISRLTSGISSPILRSAVGGGLSGGASGMVLGTGTSIAEGADVSDVFKGGLNGAAFGLSTGVVAGTVNGYLNRNNQESLVSKDRTDPKNLLEQLSLEEAKFNAGREIMQGHIKDIAKVDSYAKMQYLHVTLNGSKIEIHYWQNRVTNNKSGFKFKNNPFGYE